MSTTLVINPRSLFVSYSWFRAGKQLASMRRELANNEWRIVSSFADGRTQTIGIDTEEVSSEVGAVLTAGVKLGLLASESELTAVALKVSAPGAFFTTHQVVTPMTVAKLEAVAELVPTMISQLIELIEEVRRECPAATLVAVSDSAFHESTDVVTRQQSLFCGTGFYGLVAEAAWRRFVSLSSLSSGVVAVVHLDDVASVTTIKDGASVITSSGVTPASGVAMSTRKGDVTADAFAAYVLEHNLSIEQGIEVLYEQGGEQWSGKTTDWHELAAAYTRQDEAAVVLVSRIIFTLRSQLAAQIAHVGSIDAVVLTGDALSHIDSMRESLLADLQLFSIVVDSGKNITTVCSEGNIAANDSVPIWVVKSEEAPLMATIAAEVIASDDN